MRCSELALAASGVVFAWHLATAVAGGAEPADVARGSPDAASRPTTGGAAAFERPLTETPGDAGRGREIAFARERGNCIVCHAIPSPDMGYHGNLGPPLDGIAVKRTVAELRMRLVDSRLVNRATLMPPYHATDGLTRVGKGFAGRPVLTAQEVEDVIAFLLTLEEPAHAR